MINLSYFESGVDWSSIKHIGWVRVILILMKLFWYSHYVLGLQPHHMSLLFVLVQIKSILQKNDICTRVIMGLWRIWIVLRFVLGSEFLIYIDYIFILCAFFWAWNKILAVNFYRSSFNIIFSLESILLFGRWHIWFLKHILILQDLIQTLLVRYFWDKFSQLFSFIFAYYRLIQTKLIRYLFPKLV